MVVGALKLREDQLKKLNQDNDADGLRDWEETIFGTDSNNLDTDGDGTKDGDEVGQGRDPLLKGPNDKITPKSEDKKSGANVLNITSDFTKKFLQDPLAQILAGGQASVDPKAVEAYTERLLGQSMLNVIAITEKDINIVGVSFDSFANYFIGFEKVFTTLKVDNPESEIDITVKAFRDQEYAPLAKIDRSAQAYEKAIATMKKMGVPSDLKGLHLGILNYLLKFKKSAEIMRTAEEDPIQAMLAVNERVKLSDQFLKELSAFQKELEKIATKKQ